MVMIVKFDNEGLDQFSRSLFSSVVKRLDGKDDDNLIMAIGTTGTGKSSLMSWAYEYYMKGVNEFYDTDLVMDVDKVGLNDQDHAKALKKAKDDSFDKFCAHDEANISRRDHAKTYNKDIMKLYFQIRGLRMFHWWNNPSINIIDKEFIETRLKGLIFIYTKSVKKPRLFYYFTKKQLLDIYEKHKKLSHKILLDAGSKNAFYRGWFKKYPSNAFWNGYMLKKDSKMSGAVEEFFAKYGNSDVEVYKYNQVAEKLRVTRRTIEKNIKKGFEAGRLVPDEHFIYNGSGVKLLNDNGVEVLRDILMENNDRSYLHKKATS